MGNNWTQLLHGNTLRGVFYPEIDVWERMGESSDSDIFVTLIL